MLFEILVILLIIIVVLFFLLFFKTWHLHINFKNDNLDYDYDIKIIVLNLFFIVKSIEKNINLIIQLSIFNKDISLVNYTFISNNSKKPEKDEDNTEFLSKIKESYPLLNESKKELYGIIKLLLKICKFEESYAIINLGLSDNNLTIKFCNLLWALFAPLYPLNFRVVLTPEINQMTLKSDMNIKFDMLFFNFLRIFWIILKNKNLRKLIVLLRS